MKVKRRLKQRTIFVEVATRNVTEYIVQDEFEDVLVDGSPIKQFMKKTSFWVYLFAIAANVFQLVFTDNKWFAALAVTVIISYSFFMWKEYQRIENEYL